MKQVYDMSKIHLESDHLDDPQDFERMQTNLDAITDKLTETEVNTLIAVIDHQRSIESNACAMDDAGESI